MDQSDYFLTLAEIAVAFAGFAGIIVAISGRRDRTREEARLDLVFLKNVIWASFLALGFALLPATLLEIGVAPAQVFRWSSGAFAVVILVYTGFHIPRARAAYRDAGRGVPASYVFSIALAVATAAGAGLCALGIVGAQAYYAAVLYMIYGSASSFLRVFLSVARAASPQEHPAGGDDESA